MLSINTNVASLNAQQNLSKSQSALNTSLQRLSSGLRINSAVDDPAGLAISDHFTSQINGMNQASRNANDGVSLSQTAEGALNQMGDMVQTIRQKAVQAGNATNSSSDRQALNAEVNQLAAEMDRTAQTTQFNGQNLFDGSFTAATYQVGANANQTITATMGNMRTSQYGTFQTGGGFGTGQLAMAATGTAVSGAIGANVTMTTGVAVAASGNLTINGKTVSLTANDSAGDVASKINQAGTGVTASARTEADLSFDTGTYNLVMASNNSSYAGVSFSITGTGASDYTQAVSAFNAVQSQTGVSAQLSTFNDGTKVTYGIQLINNSGQNIQLGAAGASGFGGAVTQWQANASNTTADATTAASQYKSGGAVAIAAGGSAGITFAGQIVLNSSSAYTVQADSTAKLGKGVLTSTAADGKITDTLTTSGSMTASLKSVQSLNVSTADGATQALRIADDALNYIDGQRAQLGALQSRFTSTIANLGTSSTNLSQARSRIQDTDFASETANLTQNQILQQAGTAMLSQANQLPQGILSLLK